MRLTREELIEHALSSGATNAVEWVSHYMCSHRWRFCNSGDPKFIGWHCDRCNFDRFMPRRRDA